ncbi:hypothetical protein ACFJIV_30005 [Mucilaginibacter sp. UC70_90]
MKQENIDCLFKAIEFAISPSNPALSTDEKQKLKEIKNELEQKLMSPIDPLLKRDIIKGFVAIVVEIMKAIFHT